MICAWKALLGILPAWLRREVDGAGKEALQEIRLRCGAPPELVREKGSVFLEKAAAREDLELCLNMASRYSPWAAATSAKGYITAPGGHRIGICGTAVVQEGTLRGIREVDSLCIRVAKDYPGIAGPLKGLSGSVLILGAPGWGKTTLLRDLCRQLSREHQVCVVDERRELYPEGFDRGKRMDVLSGCPKAPGIDMLLRTMGPAYIALDEITAAEDCLALIRAANCGVFLAASAHAGSLEDFYTRPVYKPLIGQGIFTKVVLLHADKSYTLERMTL